MPARRTLTSHSTPPHSPKLSSHTARLRRLVELYPDIGNALQLGKFHSTAPRILSVRAPQFPGTQKSPTLIYHSSDINEIVIQEPISSPSLATFASGKHALEACTILVLLLETFSSADESDDDTPLSTLSQRQDLINAILSICGTSGTEFNDDPYVYRVAISHDQRSSVKTARLSILLAICHARSRQIDNLPATIIKEHYKHPKSPLFLLFDDANDPDLGGTITDFKLQGSNRLGATWARVMRFYGKQHGVFDT